MKLDRHTLLRIGGAILVLAFIFYYWNNVSSLLLGILAAATPLLFGFAIAYLVNILMSTYERYFPGSERGVVRKMRRPVCMLLAFASLVLIIIGVMYLIVPELIACVQLLTNEIPVAWNEMVAWVEQNVDAERMKQIESIVGNVNLDWQSLMKRAWDVLASGLSNAMGAMTVIISRTFSALVTVLVGVIFSIYLLAGKERLVDQIRRVSGHYLKPRWFARLRYVVFVLNDSFHRFIVGQVTEAVILGALCTLGMILFRFPYANMVGALVGFTALIPVAGAYIGAAVGAFMIFTVVPIKALFFLIFIAVLQQLEGNLIYPRVVGASIGLPGIWVLAAITVGGGVMGIGGMLLSVPLAATLYQLLRDDMGEQTLRKAK